MSPHLSAERGRMNEILSKKCRKKCGLNLILKYRIGKIDKVLLKVIFQQFKEDFVKKHYGWVIPLILMIFGLSGCSVIGEKATSLSLIYCTAAVIAFLLLMGYLLLVKRKNKWFVVLFSSVCIVNTGYTFLAVSSGLEAALMANRLSYLGSVFLPLSMLMIILGITNIKYKRWLSWTLFGIAFVVFLIAASPGILDIYYKDVSFAVVNGVSTLVKVYGPLHPIYLFYLVGYFSAMVVVIMHASIKKTIGSTSYAIIVAIAVFANIGVWLVEQLSHINFEMLSISYIITELFLLGVHLMMNENQRLKDQIEQNAAAFILEKSLKNECSFSEKKTILTNISLEEIEFFKNALITLTPTEKIIYEAYLAGTTTKVIRENLEITENTLKFHNKNIYRKLGVSSRKQLLEVSRVINV